MWKSSYGDLAIISPTVISKRNLEFEGYLRKVQGCLFKYSWDFSQIPVLALLASVRPFRPSVPFIHQSIHLPLCLCLSGPEMGKPKWVSWNGRPKASAVRATTPLNSPMASAFRQLSVSFPSAFRQLFVIHVFAYPFRGHLTVCPSVRQSVCRSINPQIHMCVCRYLYIYIYIYTTYIHT